MGRQLELSLECRVVCGERICSRDGQSARVDWIWASVYRRHQRRLGRQAICRFDARAGLRRGALFIHRQIAGVCDGRELWRLHGGLDSGHTHRFRCIVSHDGMFNPESAYGTTDELWFNEWEFKGTPWSNRATYRKWSPMLAETNFKTPTLVVHSQLDYRLDVSEGYQLFTTLQRMGVPSKMLYFPDEGHWVLEAAELRALVQDRERLG